MLAFRRLSRKLNNLSPAAVREIIAVAVILCLSAAMSLPQFLEDRKLAAAQKEALLKNMRFETASPQEQGMDSTLFERSLKNLDNTSILTLTVIRSGKIIYEKYYGSKGRNNVYSITKSIISALTGIAMREGFIQSADDPVKKYLPEYFENISDPRWEQITIGHLLTMTPGFCGDPDKWTAGDDWVKAVFSLPLQYDPGEKFQYADSASHLLSAILTRASGMNTKDFADKYLFGPLGIISPQWTADPKGYYLGHSGIYLSARDLAKFGWMYCGMGKWEDMQVVPEKWIAESTAVHYDFGKEENLAYESGYGYKWWVDGRYGHRAYSARGYGGQSISAVPDLGLEMVITCIPGDFSINDEIREELLGNLIKSCKR